MRKMTSHQGKHLLPGNSAESADVASHSNVSGAAKTQAAMPSRGSFSHSMNSNVSGAAKAQEEEEEHSASPENLYSNSNVSGAAKTQAGQAETNSADVANSAPEPKSGRMEMEAFARVCGVDAAELALAALGRVSAEKMTSGELEKLSTTLGRIRTRTSDLLRAVASVAGQDSKGVDAVHLLGGRAGLANREIRRMKRVAKRLEEMPNTSERLRSGTITFEHAAALADAGAECGTKTVDNDPRLLELAEKVPIDQYFKETRSFAGKHAPDRGKARLNWQRKRRQASLYTEESTGMGVLRALFDPISFNLLRQTVDRHTDILWRKDGGREGQPETLRTPQQRTSDAIFELLTGKPAPAHRLKEQKGTQQPARTGGEASGRTIPPHINKPKEQKGTQQTEEPSQQTPRASRSSTSEQELAQKAEEPSAAWTGRSASIHPTDASGTENNDARNNEVADDGVIKKTCSVDNESAHNQSNGVLNCTEWFKAKNAAQLVVVADIGVLDGSNPYGRCEILGTGPVPPDILQELSPDTELASIIFGGNGQPLWLGRSKRLANDHQRLAVAVRDGGCVLCDAPMHLCEIHHVKEWNSRKGPTDIENLAAICGHHHRWLHNNNQQLAYSPENGGWSTKPCLPERPPPHQKPPLRQETGLPNRDRSPERPPPHQQPPPSQKTSLPNRNRSPERPPPHQQPPPKKSPERPKKSPGSPTRSQPRPHRPPPGQDADHEPAWLVTRSRPRSHRPPHQRPPPKHSPSEQLPLPASQAHHTEQKPTQTHNSQARERQRPPPVSPRETGFPATANHLA